MALVGRGKSSPENQTQGQKVWGRLPKGWSTAHGQSHPPRCHLTLQTHRDHPAEQSEQPASPAWSLPWQRDLHLQTRVTGVREPLQPKDLPFLLGS